MSHSIVIQQPVFPQHLILLFHGVGATPRSLLPLGQWLAESMTQSMIVSVAAPYAFHLGHGFQWFSIQGVTEDNRLSRIQHAMPAFVNCVRNWQSNAKLGAENTSIIGFSQGAIMALSSTQLEPQPLAHHIISLAGRFAEQPLVKPANTSVHFLHGSADQVITLNHSQQGEAWLKALGVTTSLEVFEGLEHNVCQEMVEAVTKILERSIAPNESISA